MRSLLKSKRGLSTVVTTLIILVVSVLLATVVTFYAINVTTTRVQEEDLLIQKIHIWYVPAASPYVQAGFVLINTGGRDVVLDKIAVRGQEKAWDEIYYWKTQTAVTNDLSETNATLSGNTFNMSIDDNWETFTKGSTDLTVKSGDTAVIYIKNPDSVTLSDVGTTIGITVHTMRAQYYKECNVEAPTT